MSSINVDTIRSRTGTAPQLDQGVEVPVGMAVTGAGGINVSGYCTATEFSGRVTGAVTGNVTGNASGTAGGLSGTPDIAVNNINAGFGTFTGFVAFSTSISVGGTITYEDVTNIDVIGIATYRSDLNVGSTQGSGTGVAVTITNQGNAYFAKTGIVTATDFHTSGDGDALWSQRDSWLFS